MPQRTNILLLSADQMRYDAMGCAGNQTIQTPSLDRLAREGSHYTHAVTPVPVCVAARHSLLTGQRCAAHGRFANNTPDHDPNLPTLPRLLASVGYQTRAIGKMHFSPARRDYGFQRLELMEEEPLRREQDEYLRYLQKVGYGHVREVHGVRNLLFCQPQVSVIPEKHHGSTWVADRTIDFLGEKHDRPFFYWSSWIAPHPPWNPPEPFASMYPIEAVDPPLHWDQPLESLPHRMRSNKESCDLAFASIDHLKRIKALYWGNISLVDKGVGRILKALDQLGLAENTLVIFASDHGEMMGDHGTVGKGRPYEASMRIPFLARLPGRLESGSTSNDRVSLLDIMPTCLDLANASHPDGPALPGASILAGPRGGLAEPRDQMVVEFNHAPWRWLSLLDGPWKYNYYCFGGWEELFHLGEDPNELRNLLLENPTAAARRRGDAMKRNLERWEAEHGFSTSFDSSGHLMRCKPPDRKTVTPVQQFPRWVRHLNDAEAVEMESPGESVLNAIASEWTYQLSDLNLKAFKAAGGSLEGTEYRELLENIAE